MLHVEKPMENVVTDSEDERNGAEEKLSIRKQDFTAMRFEKSRGVRKNDLFFPVLDVILMATKCTFVSWTFESKSSSKIIICSTSEGLEFV